VHHLPRRVGILSAFLAAGVTNFPVASDAATTSGVSRGPVVVDGVPLSPITARQRGQCQKYADHLHRPVICPSLLPTPIPVSAAPGAVCPEEIGETQCGPAIFQISKEMFINQSNFQVPPGYIGAPGIPSISGGPLGHFVFIEGQTVKWYEGSGRRPKVVSVPSTCHASTSVTPTRIHGDVAKFYQCANGPMTYDTPALYLGHDLLTWRERGLLVQVSFHGHTSVNQDLDVAVAKATIVVRPRRS
jgi:hypothetical protein